MKIFYFIKAIIFLGIVGYDCSIESKYTIVWAVLSIFYMLLYLFAHIEDYIDKKFESKTE